MVSPFRSDPRKQLTCHSEVVHPWVTSCYEANFRRFFDVFVSCAIMFQDEEQTDFGSQRFMLPVYSALHLVPMLVLRRKHLSREPLRMLIRVTWGITRSCSFLGVFVFIFHSGYLVAAGFVTC